MIQPLKMFPAIGPQGLRYPLFCDGFHQAVFPVRMAQPEELDTAIGAATSAKGDAEPGRGADQIKDGEDKQQPNDHAAEIPDVLRFQSLEFDAFIDPFIDLVNRHIRFSFLFYVCV
jgi:hypothetical protein